MPYLDKQCTDCQWKHVLAQEASRAVQDEMKNPYALGGFIPDMDRNGVKVCTCMWQLEGWRLHNRIIRRLGFSVIRTSHELEHAAAKGVMWHFSCANDVPRLLECRWAQAS
eukprot:5342406-Amphidinium_carterae.2